MRLARRSEPFTDPDWLFELKYDGFCALAHVSDGECKLISRNGNAFRSFESLRGVIPGNLTTKRAVIDGEIVCLDAQGHSRFNDLVFHRGEPYFVAFDLLWCDGERKRLGRGSHQAQKVTRIYSNLTLEPCHCCSRLLRIGARPWRCCAGWGCGINLRLDVNPRPE